MASMYFLARLRLVDPGIGEMISIHQAFTFCVYICTMSESLSIGGHTLQKACLKARFGTGSQASSPRAQYCYGFTLPSNPQTSLTSSTILPS